MAMMGERTVMQEALFYEFSIERHAATPACSMKSTPFQPLHQI